MKFDLSANDCPRSRLPVDTVEEAKAIAERHMAPFVKRGYTAEWTEYADGTLVFAVRDTKCRYRGTHASIWSYLAIYGTPKPEYEGRGLA